MAMVSAPWKDARVTNKEVKMSFSPVLPLHITAGTLGIAVWMCCDLFPQRFPPAWPRWKCVCHIHADPVRKRRVPGVNEIPTGQCSGRHSNVLSGNNGMDHRQAQGWGNQHF